MYHDGHLVVMAIHGVTFRVYLFYSQKKHYDKIKLNRII